jgi:hypothetical protein
MKSIKLLLLLLLLNYLPISKCFNGPAIMLFIRDPKTNNVVQDFPLQVYYGGFFTSSNHFGQIILPRKTQNPDFYILITNQIKPIMSILNNLENIAIPAEQDFKLYRVSLQDNQEPGEQEWLVQDADLPQNRHIPLHSIVILADPNSIIMPIGTQRFVESKNILLPSIYLDQISPDQKLSTLIPNSRPFLAQLKTAYRLTPYGYATIQTR